MKNNHLLLLMFAFFVTLFVASVYGYMYYRIDVSAGKIIDAESLIQSNKLAKQREKNFLDTYKATATKWSSLQDFYIKSDEVVNFIELMESYGLLSKSEVAISSIDADSLDGAPVGKEGKIKMHLSAKGPWLSVMKVLALTETLPYKLNLSNLRASGSINTGAKGTEPKSSWDLSLDLSVAMVAVGTSTVNTK